MSYTSVLYPTQHRKMPPLNPEIYRMAARHIARGAEYCCNVIEAAAIRLGLNDEEATAHVAQFKATFGAFSRPPLMFFYPGSACWYTEGETDAPLYEKHPFWDKPGTPRRQEYRIMSLLMMAEICEQGSN